MVKVIISNNTILHEGNFGINVVISHPISDIYITDCMFTNHTGNGMMNIGLPDSLDVVYIGKHKKTVFMIPIDVPDNVEGSFSVTIRDRQYTIDNTQYDNSPDVVGLYNTEQSAIECIPQIFRYNTIVNQ